MTNVTLLAAVGVVVVVVKVVVVVVDRLVADVHVEMRLTRFFCKYIRVKKVAFIFRSFERKIFLLG